MTQILSADSERLNQKDIREEIGHNFERVEVFYKSLNFELIEETPMYTPTTLLSNIGGNIGLWLGWTALTLLEIIQWIYHSIVLTWRFYKK